MTGVGTFTVEDSIGILKIDSPPVNSLSNRVCHALAEGFSQFEADDSVKAIVLICGGRTFFAGADIGELDNADSAMVESPDLGAILHRAEYGSKPLIAAIHGTALGGGYELALNCHYRIAVPSARVGLPEVKLGLLPGGKGTQRLPRIVGALRALDIMIGGNPIPAPEALKLGMIDAIAEEGRLHEDAVAFAHRILAEGKPLQRARDRQDMVDPDKGNTQLFADYRRANAKLLKGFKAPEAIIRCVEAAVELPYEAGVKREWELFEELLASQESAAQRYYFFAEREAAKVPGIGAATPTYPVQSVGIIGAGTMGSGIALVFLDAGLPVTLVEADQAALDRGTSKIERHYATAVAKGRMSEADRTSRLGRLSPALALEALANADLVIEAVYEDMAAKSAIMARLDEIAKPEALLATNTSYLDIDAISASTQRPQSVLGLHFFAPANIMRLVEVVRAARTSDEAVATAMKLARRIGKVPVLSGVADGFIANRIMSRRNVQAEALILEGTSPEAVDRVMEAFGFPMGPFRVRDLSGVDIGMAASSEQTVRGELIKLGRLGQKSGGGYYDYDERRNATPSPIATEVIARVAEAHGIADQGPQPDDEILARLLYPVVNEGARLLEEGIALRASDIDVACITGYGWPVYTGGPMFWADTIGLRRIVDKLASLEARHGDAFRPSNLLVAKAERGENFTR